MYYQWGHKDPFIFATNSEKSGSEYREKGKYPVKIYTIDGVLIYQDEIGGSNKDKQPVGGVIVSSTMASSVMVTVKNPIIYYYAGWNVNINQVGHTRDLWDYYWTSYSRGSDGYSSWNATLINDKKWHNVYLDKYTSQRSKSIYDPCPYGFRVPVNGVYEDLKKSVWIRYSYNSGGEYIIQNNKTWLSILGARDAYFKYCGFAKILSTSTYYTSVYSTAIVSFDIIYNSTEFYHTATHSVRCIEGF